MLRNFLSNIFYLLAGCSESWSQESPFTSDRSKCGNDLASPSHNTIHNGKVLSCFFLVRNDIRFEETVPVWFQKTMTQNQSHIHNKQKIQKQNDIYKNTAAMKYYNIRCGGWYAQGIWQPIRHQPLSI